MKFTKKAQAGVLIAAVVSVVAVVGLFLASSGSSHTTGAQVMYGVAQDTMYRDYGVRTAVEAEAWEVGIGLGNQLWENNQANRECITECSNACDALHTTNDGNIVNVCFTACKSACEKTMREQTMTGGYFTP